MYILNLCTLFVECHYITWFCFHEKCCLFCLQSNKFKPSHTTRHHLPLPYLLLLFIPITYLLLLLILALNLFASSACLRDECARPPFVTVSSPRFVLRSKQLLHLCPNVSSTGLDFESKHNVCNFSLIPICIIFPIVARAKFICAKDYQKAKFIFCLSPALKAFFLHSEPTCLSSH